MPGTPSGPEPDAAENIAGTATELADAIVQLTREILIQSANPQVGPFSQLVLRRAKLIEELNRLDFLEFELALRDRIREKLEICRKMDETIEQNMVGHRDTMDEQLKGLREARNLLGKYRSQGPDTAGTRSEEA